jgi:hypothetical protein
MVDSKCQYK